MAPAFLYARHGRSLKGASPERGLVAHQPLADGEGVRGDAESSVDAGIVLALAPAGNGPARPVREPWRWRSPCRPAPRPAFHGTALARDAHNRGAFLDLPGARQFVV